MKESNRRIWGRSQKRKQGPTLYWRAYHFTHGEYNKPQAVTIVILALIILIPTTAYGFYGNGLFHSYLKSTRFLDPAQALWNSTSPGSDLSEYNSVNAAYTTSTPSSQAAIGLSPVGRFPETSAVTMTTDCGGTAVASCTDPPPSHNLFFAQSQYWGFEPGSPTIAGGSCPALTSCVALNWTTTSNPVGGSWTEHGQAGSGFPITTCGIGESTELSVANNGTFVFVWITPRGTGGCFNYGQLGANGAITWQSWQTGIITTTQAQDAAIGYQASTGLVYLFYACANSCGVGHTWATANYLSSTTSKLNVWNTPQLLIGSNTCANDFQGTAIVDQMNGNMILSYGQFYSHSNPNCSGGGGIPITHWYSREVSNATMYPQVQVPDPPGFGNRAFWSYIFFDTINNRVTGAFEYAVSDANATFRDVPLFSTYMSNSATFAGTWATPSLQSNTVAQLNSNAGFPACPNTDCNENLLQCVGYSQSLGEYVIEHQTFGNVGAQTNSLEALVTDNNFNVINATSPFVSLGSYTYSGSGQCEEYIANTANAPLTFVSGSKPGTWKEITVNLNQQQPTAIALSKSPVSLATVSAKNLFFAQLWSYSGSGPPIGTGSAWGMFLTTNATLAGPGVTYNPYTDPNVALLIEFYNNSATQITMVSYLQRSVGSPISANDPAGCSATGDCFLSRKGGTSGPTTNWINSGLDLNFTGNTNQSVCTSTLDFLGFIGGGGSGCSLGAFGVVGAGVQAAHTTTFPWLNIQTASYYVGFFALPNSSSSTISWVFGGRAAGECGVGIAAGPFSGYCNEIDIFVPSPPANIAGVQIVQDTGGSFGWIGRGLSTIANFVVGGAKGFYNTVIAPVFNAVTGLEGPFIAALASIVSLIAIGVQTVGNSIGNAIGLGNIGTEFVSFFSGIINWFNSILTVAFGWIVSVGGVFGSGIAFITNIFSTSNPFFGQLTSFFTQVPGLIAILGTYWNIFTYWTISLSGFIQWLLVFIWIWGIWEVYQAPYGKSTEAFKDWAHTVSDFTVLVFDVAIEIIQLTIQFLVSVKQLIAGWI